jgi:hypothetical protein
MNTRSFLLSVLIAGLITGVLGNLPVLNLVNCALCVFAWLGGILAVIFYKSFQKGGPVATPGQGAGLGALTGLVGAVVGALVYAITSPLSIPIFNSMIRLFQIEGDFPFTRGTGIGEILTSTFVFLICDAILYPLFGAIAGLIAASLIKGPAQEPAAA